MSRRLERANELIKEELSQILLKEINLEKNIFLTVIDAKTSNDLRYADIMISVFPSEKGQKVFKQLEKNIFHIQQIFNKKLRMRSVPKIRFRLDRTSETLTRLNTLLQEEKKLTRSND